MLWHIVREMRRTIAHIAKERLAAIIVGGIVDEVDQLVSLVVRLVAFR